MIQSILSNSFVGVLSIGATTLFGILSIIQGFYLYRRFKYPIELMLYDKRSIDLYKSISRKFEDLKVIYKDTPVNENMYLISGKIIQMGRKDITEAMIEKPLKIIFEETAKVHEAKVRNCSPDLDATITVENNSCEIHFRQFKRREYIEFEILLECSTDPFSSDDMKVVHRIADTSNSIKSIGKSPEPVYILGIGLIVFSLILFLSMYWSSSFQKAPFSIKYSLCGLDTSAKPIDIYSLKLNEFNAMYKNDTSARRKAHELLYIAETNVDSILSEYTIIDRLKENETILTVDDKGKIIYFVDRSKLKTYGAMCIVLFLLGISLLARGVYLKYKYRIFKKIIATH